MLPQRRLDDQIRHLCNLAMEAEGSEELTPILSKILEAIHIRTTRLRKLALAAFDGSREFPSDRRKTS